MSLEEDEGLVPKENLDKNFRKLFENAYDKSEGFMDLMADFFSDIGYKIQVTALVLTCAAVVGAGIFFGKRILDDEAKRETLRKNYEGQSSLFMESFNDKLSEYGDMDGNGIISDQERLDLGLKMLKNKKILLQENYRTFYGFPVPRYSNGENFSITDLTKIIKEYRE